MEGLDLTSLYTTIGGVLGTPAALAFFWLWNKVKELEKRLNEGISFDCEELKYYNVLNRKSILCG